MHGKLGFKSLLFQGLHYLLANGSIHWIVDLIIIQFVCPKVIFVDKFGRFVLLFKVGAFTRRLHAYAEERAIN